MLGPAFAFSAVAVVVSVAVEFGCVLASLSIRQLCVVFGGGERVFVGMQNVVRVQAVSCRFCDQESLASFCRSASTRLRSGE